MGKDMLLHHPFTVRMCYVHTVLVDDERIEVEMTEAPVYIPHPVLLTLLVNPLQLPAQVRPLFHAIDLCENRFRYDVHHT